MKNSHQLTEHEKKALDLLKEIKQDSLWNLAIKDVLAYGDATGFRALVTQLKSQAKDNAEVMKNILGQAYDAVVAL